MGKQTEQQVADPTPAGLRAMTEAYKRITRDGYAHLCPLRIGKNFGPAVETAVLLKLAKQGYSDGAPAPRLTAAGIEYVRARGAGITVPRQLTRAELDERDDRIFRADCIRERSHRHGG